MIVRRFPLAAGRLSACQSGGWFYKLSVFPRTQAQFKMISSIGPSDAPPSATELLYRVTAPGYEMSNAVTRKPGNVNYFLLHTYTGPDYESTLNTLQSL